MFMLIWIILLPSYAEADDPELGFPSCYRGFCVTLNKDVITAEAGLCAVIHCSWNTPSDYYLSSLSWYKCEPSGSCSDSDIIFHSSNKNKTQSSFSGRVSLLEPDLSRRNCSIIINDLRLSDSGRYFLKLNRRSDGFGFTFNRATVSVKALQQKPTVQTPALTEGQRAALTCTAPGLCSGSEPTFTWTWRGAGDARPNVTTATTDRLTPVSHRHSSTLELTASAELHGAELSCTVSYNHSSSSTQDSVRINVTSKPLILSSSGCVYDGAVLSCSCISRASPVPAVTWPLLQHRSEYTLVTAVTGYTVNSSLVLRASGHNRTGVQCVSSNRAGQVQERFTPSITDPERTDAPVTVSLLSALIVSLILHVVFIVVIVVLVLKLRTKKPNHEDRVYMSLQKRETSCEYEVIARPKS